MAGQTDVVVLGGGPGGYAAAFHAADLGLAVTLVDERARPGGVCLHVGCIPSKTLLHVAALLRAARGAEEFGVRFEEPVVDLGRLGAFRDGVVEKLTKGLSQLCSQRKVRYVQGRGRFTGPKTLLVAHADGGDEELPFANAIIATGSAPRTLPPLDIGSDRVWDSTQALSLPEVPRRLLVVGGGYIGAELATVYSALGSDVTVVELTSGLLPGVDPDLVRPLAQAMGRDMQVLLNSRVDRLQQKGDGLSAQISSEGGEQRELAFDRALVSVGRAPCTAAIGLDALGIAVDDRGFIPVGADRRTAVEHVFAIGDVTGQPMLAHKASHEGRVAAEAIAGKRAAFDPQAIPAVVFTDPEIAWAGLTEAQAKAEGVKVQVSRFPWAASGRAATLGRTDGVTKLLADPGTGRLLGIGMSGPGAGELIAEGVLAIEMDALAEDVARTIHPHPTLSETMMEAAEGLIGKSTHFYGR